MDYSKWEKLERETEEAEKRERDAKTAAAKHKYEREEREKRKKWELAQPEEAEKRERDAKTAAAKQKYEREEREKREKWEAEHPDEAQRYREGGHHSCGFANPEHIRQIQEGHKHPKTPEIPLDEKNRKKVRAVHATREDGNIHFKKGDYETAYAIYERGVMIISGMYGMEDDEYSKMVDIERILDLNMALCKIKLKDYAHALSLCRMSQKFEVTAKSHFRMAQAYVGLGELDNALASLREAEKLNTTDKAVQAKISEVLQLQKDARAKEKNSQKRFAASMKTRRGPE